MSEIYRSQIIPCQTAPMVRQSECHICPMIDEHFEQASSDIEVNYIKWLCKCKVFSYNVSSSCTDGCPFCLIQAVEDPRQSLSYYKLLSQTRLKPSSKRKMQDHVHYIFKSLRTTNHSSSSSSAGPQQPQYSPSLVGALQRWPLQYHMALSYTRTVMHVDVSTHVHSMYNNHTGTCKFNVQWWH